MAGEGQPPQGKAGRRALECPGEASAPGPPPPRRSPPGTAEESDDGDEGLLALRGTEKGAGSGERNRCAAFSVDVLTRERVHVVCCPVLVTEARRKEPSSSPGGAGQPPQGKAGRTALECPGEASAPGPPPPRRSPPGTAEESDDGDEGLLALRGTEKGAGSGERNRCAAFSVDVLTRERVHVVCCPVLVTEARRKEPSSSPGGAGQPPQGKAGRTALECPGEASAPGPPPPRRSPPGTAEESDDGDEGLLALRGTEKGAGSGERNRCAAFSVDVLTRERVHVVCCPVLVTEARRKEPSSSPGGAGQPPQGKAGRTALECPGEASAPGPPPPRRSPPGTAEESDDGDEGLLALRGTEKGAGSGERNRCAAFSVDVLTRERVHVVCCPVLVTEARRKEPSSSPGGAGQPPQGKAGRTALECPGEASAPGPPPPRRSPPGTAEESDDGDEGLLALRGTEKGAGSGERNRCAAFSVDVLTRERVHVVCCPVLVTEARRKEPSSSPGGAGQPPQGKAGRTALECPGEASAPGPPPPRRSPPGTAEESDDGDEGLLALRGTEKGAGSGERNRCAAFSVDVLTRERVHVVCCPVLVTEARRKEPSSSPGGAGQPPQGKAGRTALECPGEASAPGPPPPRRSPPGTAEESDDGDEGLLALRGTEKGAGSGERNRCAAFSVDVLTRERVHVVCCPVLVTEARRKEPSSSPGGAGQPPQGKAGRTALECPGEASAPGPPPPRRSPPGTAEESDDGDEGLLALRGTEKGAGSGERNRCAAFSVDVLTRERVHVVCCPVLVTEARRKEPSSSPGGAGQPPQGKAGRTALECPGEASAPGPPPPRRSPPGTAEESDDGDEGLLALRGTEKGAGSGERNRCAAFSVDVLTRERVHVVCCPVLVTEARRKEPSSSPGGAGQPPQGKAGRRALECPGEASAPGPPPPRRSPPGTAEESDDGDEGLLALRGTEKGAGSGERNRCAAFSVDVLTRERVHVVCCPVLVTEARRKEPSSSPGGEGQPPQGKAGRTALECPGEASAPGPPPPRRSPPGTAEESDDGDEGLLALRGTEKGAGSGERNRCAEPSRGPAPGPPVVVVLHGPGPGPGPAAPAVLLRCPPPRCLGPLALPEACGSPSPEAAFPSGGCTARHGPAPRPEPEEKSRPELWSP
ncbi:basic proline-rich protein-like [Accipiter gentilis]|uniref:basic proline-rich protein-like n=1 Tax=Astur gentilis TaxID=8957 RepID=UPI00210FDBF3|nr:basic proline-rich protein-like [Accipiter gentilis]